jgi:hypothetical protein
VRDLLGGGEVGDEVGRDAEAVRSRRALMSTAALPSRSIAEIRCSTLDICSASRGDARASTQISRISCTRSLRRSSSS